MTRQLISTAGQPPIRPPHAKRPPQSDFVQVAFPEYGLLAAEVPDVSDLVQFPRAPRLLEQDV
jgi:hypothetical protein